MLKVVEGNGFKIYSGFDDIEYTLKGLSGFRARYASREEGEVDLADPAILEANITSFRNGSGDSCKAWSKVSDPSQFYIHISNEWPTGANATKPVHHAKLFFGDGVEKNIIFETGFLCNEQGDTIEQIR